METSSYHQKFAFLPLSETDSSGRPRLPGCVAALETSTLNKLLDVEPPSTDSTVQDDKTSPQVPTQEPALQQLRQDESTPLISEPQTVSTEDLVEHMLIHSLRNAEDHLDARLDEIEEHGLILNEIWRVEKNRLEQKSRDLDDKHAELRDKLREVEAETVALKEKQEDVKNEKMALLTSKQIYHNIQKHCVRQLKALDEKEQILKTRELKLKEGKDEFDRARKPAKREQLRSLIEGMTNKDELTAVLHLTLRCLADGKNTVAEIFGVAIDRIILPQMLRHPTRQMSWEMFQNYVISPMRAKLYPVPQYTPAAGPLTRGSGLVVPKSLASEPIVPLTTVDESENENGNETENATQSGSL